MNTLILKNDSLFFDGFEEIQTELTFNFLELNRFTIVARKMDWRVLRQYYSLDNRVVKNEQLVHKLRRFGYGERIDFFYHDGAYYPTEIPNKMEIKMEDMPLNK